jgi:hypothetical protein
VFGGNQTFGTTTSLDEVIIGEKFAVRENKWRDIVSRSVNSSAAKLAMKTLMQEGTVFGPVQLLYE